MKTALCQVADTGPLESLALVLREAGYRCVLPGPKVRKHLRDLGCDVVLAPEDLVRGWGYEPPRDPTAGDRPFLEEPDPSVLGWCDLYVDVKAHRNGPKVWTRHPRLKDRTLWYRINGGEPEHVITPDGTDHGDEVNPPCPVLTPNRWYSYPNPYNDVAYSFWPPFARWDDHALSPRKVPGQGGGRKGGYEPAMCLVHNAPGWGYGRLIEPAREIGVRVHGHGSPDGLLPHREAAIRLSSTLAYVHLKSNDAPGYALYEAMAAGCPVVAPRRLVWRCRMHELFEEGRTYLAFDRETHDPLTAEDVHACVREIRGHLQALHDPEYNRKVGEAGRERLRSLLWTADRDGDGLRDFMRRNFP